MSRYDLLPPNATQLERDISRATSSLQRVAPPVPIIRTAKRVDIPDSVVPWLIYEYGLGEILPYLGNDQRLALRDGVLWQRIRGTPESVRIALSWIGIEGLIEEPHGWMEIHWAEYMLGLAAATDGDEVIDRIVAIAKISSPVRSRLQRIYAVHDFRLAVWGEFRWGDGSVYSDHSGVRPRTDWPQISYGRKYRMHAVWDGPPPPPAPPRLAGHAQLISTWRWGEDEWGQGWHMLHPRTSTKTQRGVSAQYVGQDWAPIKWQYAKWGDVNVVASSALNGIPTAPLYIASMALTAATGAQGGILNAGDTITATVTTNRPAIVTGTPQLALQFGETTRNANYTSGSGTQSLVFEYTIQSGDNAPAGVAIPANALALNGGSIGATDGNVLSLSTPAVPANNSFIVDTTLPTAAGISLAVDNGANTSDGVSTNGTVNVTGLEAGAAWSYSINSGSTWTAGSGSSFVLAAGTYPVGTVRARQIDSAGNQGVSGQNQMEFVIYDPFTIPLIPGVSLTVTGTRGRLSHVTRVRTRNSVSQYITGSECQFSYPNYSSSDWSGYTNLPSPPVGIRAETITGTCPLNNPGPRDVRIFVVLANGEEFSAFNLNAGFGGFIGISVECEFDTTDPKAGPIP